MLAPKPFFFFFWQIVKDLCFALPSEHSADDLSYCSRENRKGRWWGEAGSAYIWERKK